MHGEEEEKDVGEDGVVENVTEMAGGQISPEELLWTPLEAFETINIVEEETESVLNRLHSFLETRSKGDQVHRNI